MMSSKLVSCLNVSWTVYDRRYTPKRDIMAHGTAQPLSKLKALDNRLATTPHAHDQLIHMIFTNWRVRLECMHLTITRTCSDNPQHPLLHEWWKRKKRNLFSSKMFIYYISNRNNKKSQENKCQTLLSQCLCLWSRSQLTIISLNSIFCIVKIQENLIKINKRYHCRRLPLCFGRRDILERWRLSSNRKNFLENKMR